MDDPLQTCNRTACIRLPDHWHSRSVPHHQKRCTSATSTHFLCSLPQHGYPRDKPGTAFRSRPIWNHRIHQRTFPCVDHRVKVPGISRFPKPDSFLHLDNLHAHKASGDKGRDAMVRELAQSANRFMRSVRNRTRCRVAGAYQHLHGSLFRPRVRGVFCNLGSYHLRKLPRGRDTVAKEGGPPVQTRYKPVRIERPEDEAHKEKDHQDHVWYGNRWDILLASVCWWRDHGPAVDRIRLHGVPNEED